MVRCARQLSTIVCSVALVAFTWNTSFSRVLAQDCWNEDAAAIGRTQTGYVTADGIHHVTYRIPSNMSDSGIVGRIVEAVEQWNSKTSITKVVFEPWINGVPYPGQPPSFSFGIMPYSEMPCGRYIGGDNQTILLHDNWIKAASGIGEPVANDKLAQVVAHELGHPINLGHRDSGIMKVPEYVQCNSTSMNTFPGTRVEDPDAQAARPCIVAARSGQPAFSGNENYEDLGYTGEDCWNHWRVYYGWNYVGTDANGNDQFQLVELFRTLLDSGCGPPPM